MPTTPTFNTPEGQTIGREQLVLYLNTGTSGSPTWSPIGTRVEDSSMEYDWGEETSQDILGITHSTMKNPVVKQTFDGIPLSEGDPAYEKLWELGIKSQDHHALTNLDLLVAHLYAGTAATPFAERYPSSMLRPTNLGGEGGGNLVMDVEATYGGVRSTGTVTKDSTTGAVSYTEAA